MGVDKVAVVREPADPEHDQDDDQEEQHLRRGRLCLTILFVYK